MVMGRLSRRASLGGTECWFGLDKAGLFWACAQSNIHSSLFSHVVGPESTIHPDTTKHAQALSCHCVYAVR